MGKFGIQPALRMAVGFCVCCLLVEPALAQVDVRTLPEAEQQRRQQQVDAEIRRRQAAEDAVVASFLLQRPEERVRLWRCRYCRNIPSVNTSSRMEELLIARGTDAAPYLAEIVRAGKSFDRLFALKLLCDMDRFVPAEQLIIPEAGEYPEKLADGRRDLFMIVDGRRIGPEAYTTLRWAAEQTQDKDLRFHARQYAGLLDQDLRKLALSDQFAKWREAVIKSKGLNIESDYSVLQHHLGKLLVERAPDSLGILTEILENDRNGYVQEEAIQVIIWIDRYRMRLRRSEIGRKAVEAAHQALERGGLKPTYTKRESREDLWKQISSEVFDDGPTPEGGVNWAFYALALERLYGVKATVPGTRGQHPTPDSSPEWRRFMTYLTEVDPFFPSWEYTNVGVAASEELHPKFKARMGRYYEQWKRFQAGEPPRP